MNIIQVGNHVTSDGADDEFARLCRYRQVARAVRAWKIADEIMDMILGEGYEIRDRNDGLEVARCR